MRKNDCNLAPINNFGPFAPFDNLFRGFDDMFDLIPRNDRIAQMLSDFNGVRSDIKETDKSYIVEAELPGFKKEDIKLDMDDEILTITAETNSETENNDTKYVHKERYSGKVMRQYSFKNVNSDAITAKYDNGVLQIELPKKEPTTTKNSITID